MASFCCSPVSKAIIDNDFDKLQALMAKGTRIDIVDNLGWTPLHIAVNKKRTTMVDLLLSQPDAPINHRSYEGFTCFMLACKSRKNLGIIKNLIKHGSNVNIGDNENVTPLHIACKNNNLKLVRLLLENGANVNSQDFNDYTPLHYAVEIESRSMIDLLLKNGADTSLNEANNLNPLMLALTFCDKIDNLLLPYTQDVDATANDGWTALMFAVNRLNERATKELIRRGANVNVRAQGHTPLCLAVRAKHFEIFKAVCDNVDYSKVLDNNILARRICHSWTVQHHYSFYCHLFNSPRIQLRFNNMTNLFVKPFSYDHIDNVPEKTNIFTILEHFINRGARFCEDDVNAFFEYFRNTSFQVELFEYIISRNALDVVQTYVLSAVSECPELVPLLIRYCYNVDSTNIYFEKFCTYSLALLTYFLNRFTLSLCRRNELLSMLTKYVDVRPEKTEAYKLIHILKSRSPVKSLLELSRDAVQKRLQSVCNSTPQYVRAVNDLGLPEYIQNIVRYSVPVNKL